MKKILFLDIDGVLAGEAWFERCWQDGRDPDFLDPDLVRKLNALDCEVVISSSWGSDNGQTWKKLRRRGFNLKVIGYTEHFEMSSDWIVRGNCIKKWLNDNLRGQWAGEDYKYVILDDDDDMLLEQKDNFVKVDSYYGLTDENIEQIKKIFES